MPFVKVRCKNQRGMFRAGIHWPPEETSAEVTEDQLEALKGEPLLTVKEVSSLSGDEKTQVNNTALPARELTDEEKAEQQEQLKSADFPNEGARGKNVVAPPATGTTLPTPSQEPFRVSDPTPPVSEPSPDAGPPKHDDEPKSETVIGSHSGVSPSSPPGESKKKR
jgi:Mu-like prophage FluMu N-terminal domain